MGKNKEDFGSILKKENLEFKTGKDLEKYYEGKWKKEGYKGGYKLFGINISKKYHQARHDVSLELLNPQKSDIILDAGCGDGSWDFRIAKKCKKIIGVDISKNAFLKSKKKALKNMSFQKMNIESLKFPNKSFDKIYCVEAIEHLLHYEKALKEFNRVLKPRGKLIVSYPLADKTVVGKIGIALHIRKPIPISEHLTEWSYSETIENIEKQGFKLVNIKGVAFDIGFLYGIRKWAKFLVLPITNLVLWIQSFPRNSTFMIMEFEKA